MAKEKKQQPEHEFDFFTLHADSLDYEWTRQAELYFTYACKAATARAEADQAKTEVDLVYGELDQDIRTDPKGFGLKKVTEGSIKGCILSHEKYSKAKAAANKAKHQSDTYQAAVDALEHRKKALEKLVDLTLCNYYSRPRASGPARDRMGEVETKSVMGKIEVE